MLLFLHSAWMCCLINLFTINHVVTNTDSWAHFFASCKQTNNSESVNSMLGHEASRNSFVNVFTGEESRSNWKRTISHKGKIFICCFVCCVVLGKFNFVPWALLSATFHPSPWRSSHFPHLEESVKGTCDADWRKSFSSQLLQWSFCGQHNSKDHSNRQRSRIGKSQGNQIWPWRRYFKFVSVFVEKKKNNGKEK